MWFHLKYIIVLPHIGKLHGLEVHLLSFSLLLEWLPASKSLQTKEKRCYFFKEFQLTSSQMLSVWQHLAIEDKISSESYIGCLPLKDRGRGTDGGLCYQILYRLNISSRLWTVVKLIINAKRELDLLYYARPELIFCGELLGLWQWGRQRLVSPHHHRSRRQRPRVGVTLSLVSLSLEPATETLGDRDI